MKKLLLFMLLPSWVMGYKATLINGSDVPLKFDLHTSLLNCCCGNPVWDCAKEGGPGQCPEEHVAPNTTRVHDLTGACSGACWTGVEVYKETPGMPKLGYVSFAPGACEDVWVMVYGKKGDYRLDKKGGGDVGHILKKGFEDFGQAIQIDKIAKFPQILQKGFEIMGLGTEIAALEVKLGSLQASQKAAAGFLDGMKKMTGGLLHGLPDIVKGLQVRKIEFEGSVSEVAKGMFPKGSFEIMIGGQTLAMTDVQLDPRKPADAIQKLVEKGIREVKKTFEKVLGLADKAARVVERAEAGMPGGSYLQSCEKCQLDPMGILTCECKGPGNMVHTTLDTTICDTRRGLIDNNNGNLTCPKKFKPLLPSVGVNVGNAS